MESNQIKDLFENQNFILSNEAYNLIKELFVSNLSAFKEIRFKDWGPQFILIYKNPSISISFGSDRGDLNYSLEVCGQEINLKKYDLHISNAVLLSKKNILYVFKVMKRYLEEKNLLE